MSSIYVFDVDAFLFLHTRENTMLLHTYIIPPEKLGDHMMIAANDSKPESTIVVFGHTPEAMAFIAQVLSEKACKIRFSDTEDHSCVELYREVKKRHPALTPRTWKQLFAYRTKVHQRQFCSRLFVQDAEACFWFLPSDELFDNPQFEYLRPIHCNNLWDYVHPADVLTSINA